MTAALFNNQGGNFADVVDAYVYPQFIGYGLRAPTAQDIYPAGTRIQDNSVNPAQIYLTTGSGLWYLQTNFTETPATATGGSPQTVNARSFSVTFTGVSIAAAATQSFTIANSTIKGASTIIQYTMIGGTTGAALYIQSVTNSAGQSVIVVGNGTGATTSTANLTFIGIVQN